ncbi:Uncharacterized protein MK0912 [Methanopyrus kandleri AV19]|uniref:Uncharacterized protein n=1 Tax=Methanopyrus kandleri (strain AV19 / DSM 6324 / JCM 9639 / NBRC 100938) TaxID=190192 RepID=Q8TWW9_METKA|nr:Uncharacterized protein MK0912 [Methanopyrus kandleri AV19]
MSSDPRRPTKVPWVKAMVIGLIAVMSAKALFHEWVVATLHPTNKDRLVMKVERVPCRTGDDLRPGNVEVYAKVYGCTKYATLGYGSQDPRRILVPALPPRLMSLTVTVAGNVIRVFRTCFPAPFIIVTATKLPRISVNQYEIRIHSPCKILLQPTVTGLLKYFPPVFITDGKSTRNPTHLTCRNVAIIMPYALTVMGGLTPIDVVSVVSVSGERLVVNASSVYAPKGVTIKWEPICPLIWTTYADIVWRWPYWPYSL